MGAIFNLFKIGFHFVEHHPNQFDGIVCAMHPLAYLRLCQRRGCLLP
jgi:hypothetical protein